MGSVSIPWRCVYDNKQHYRHIVAKTNTHGHICILIHYRDSFCNKCL